MAGGVRYDCRFYLGDRPCGFAEACEGCPHYAPVGSRILIVKLAAAGDVLRATSVLPPLKRKYPDSHVTWIADQAALPLIALNPHIDRAMPFGFETWLRVSSEAFDLAVGLDKEPRAGALLRSIRADTALGFGLSRWGTIEPLNDGAHYDLALGLSDAMKFGANTKTYPEIFCEIAELDYRGEPYELVLPDASIEYARRFLSDLEPREPLVGLNVGSGSVFANKAWTAEGFAALAGIVAGRMGGTALVLGGAADRGSAGQGGRGRRGPPRAHGVLRRRRVARRPGHGGHDGDARRHRARRTGGRRIRSDGSPGDRLLRTGEESGLRSRVRPVLSEGLRLESVVHGPDRGR
jgi:hypothetical protein